jgi:hypothetical protein
MKNPEAVSDMCDFLRIRSIYVYICMYVCIRSCTQLTQMNVEMWAQCAHGLHGNRTECVHKISCREMCVLCMCMLTLTSAWWNIWFCMHVFDSFCEFENLKQV